MLNKFCPLRSNATAQVPCDRNCEWALKDGVQWTCAVAVLAENVGDVQQTLIDLIPTDKN